jgi:prepilin-type N-terminal cleavage/methylation domain-containing protein
MSHTFKKISLRGFTLIELLVVIAIIGLLSTVIAAPITQARKKGRDGKKVADLHQIQGALQQYADDHVGNYPPTIATLSPVYLANVPPFASSTAPVKDKYMYTAYVADTSSSTIGFHLGTKLEAASLALGDDRDCYGAGPVSPTANYCAEESADSASKVSGYPGNFANVTYGTAPSNFASDEKVLGISALPFPTAVLSAYDFGGGSDTADAGVTPCSAVTYQIEAGTKPACIYDITN